MKKLFTILILLSVFIGLSFGQVSTNGLIGYWPFNGNANDESGNGHNGTVTGATLTTDRFGNVNSAYSFNGTNNDIYMDIGSVGLNTTFSISIWINHSTSHTNMYDEVMGYGSVPNTSNFYFHFAHYAPFNDEIYVGYGLASTYVPSYNQWHHIYIECNYSGASNFYIDGVLNATKSSPITLSLSNNKIYLGHCYANSPYWYKGMLDDFRIYNRVLTPTEITALYNENITKCSVTVTDTLVINANLTGFNPITYQNNIKIYPNPTFSQITIDCGSNYNTLNGYTIKILNSLSQTVYTSLVNKQISTINLKTWTGKGIYIIQLIDGNQNIIENKKIVLQ